MSMHKNRDVFRNDEVWVKQSYLTVEYLKGEGHTYMGAPEGAFIILLEKHVHQ